MYKEMLRACFSQGLLWAMFGHHSLLDISGVTKVSYKYLPGNKSVL
jgi:hypothetical protein